MLILTVMKTGDAPASDHEFRPHETYHIVSDAEPLKTWSQVRLLTSPPLLALPLKNSFAVRSDSDESNNQEGDTEEESTDSNNEEVSKDEESS